VVDPQLINFYAPYRLDTPNKFTGSFAYIFGKTGLISIDYSIKEYGRTKFQPENDPYYRNVNGEMNTILNDSGELRLGAEYKIKEWSLRGGYRFEESPYKNKTTIGDLNSFSGGLGYNFGMFKLDLSYTNAQRSSQQGFFNQGFRDGAKINTTNNNFSMTLLFEM
jgi:long-subunit fatty acid transport protein